jgi:hypothetical protein
MISCKKKNVFSVPSAPSAKPTNLKGRNSPAKPAPYLILPRAPPFPASPPSPRSLPAAASRPPCARRARATLPTRAAARLASPCPALRSPRLEEACCRGPSLPQCPARQLPPLRPPPAAPRRFAAGCPEEAPPTSAAWRGFLSLGLRSFDSSSFPLLSSCRAQIR